MISASPSYDVIDLGSGGSCRGITNLEQLRMLCSALRVRLDDALAAAFGAAGGFGKRGHLPHTIARNLLTWLKGRDLDLVMGEALCNWIGWRRPA